MISEKSTSSASAVDAAPGDLFGIEAPEALVSHRNDSSQCSTLQRGSRPPPNDSESLDDSPVVSRGRKTRKRIIAPSSESDSEVGPSKPQRKRASGAKRVIDSDSEEDPEISDDDALCPICLGKLNDSDLQGIPKCHDRYRDNQRVHGAPYFVEDHQKYHMALKNRFRSLAGRPDSCSHTFCFHCIRTWSQKDSTCVLCRAPIKALKVVLRGEFRLSREKFQAYLIVLLIFHRYHGLKSRKFGHRHRTRRVTSG